MASREEIALVSHLMRRAGFGATPDELEEYTAKGYEAVVEDMVNPERCPEIEEDIVARYWGGEAAPMWVGTWIYRMANSRRPLVEKMALFWHQVLATGISKTEHPLSAIAQIDMFRRVGLSNLKTVLPPLRGRSRLESLFRFHRPWRIPPILDLPCSAM